MPKINREEYEILKSLDEKWKWIARNEDRCLYALTEKPVKKYDPSLYWDTETGEPYAALELFDERHLFQFIQWEDEKPYNIAELIGEYESEETEVKKDIEWLKNKLKEIREKNDKGNNFEGAASMNLALRLIDQLDEPEVLSQEMPEIPQYVAKWIEENKKQNKSLIFAIAHIYDENEIGKSPDEDTNKIFLWMESADNEEVFARAWLDGYTAEEGQKYVVKLPMSKNNDNQYAIVDYSGNIWIDALPSKYKLTEEEIRGLTKGDVLFEHFAVKVEELEE